MSRIFHDMVYGFVDFPNALAATLYFPGCNLSCPYCYNQDVVSGRPHLSLEDVDAELTKLDKTMMGNKVSVVLSGGEPTACICTFQHVVDFFHASGRRMALHTNGLNHFRDMFASVIISIKTTNDGVRDLAGYRARLLETMQHGCKAALYRELRIVDHLGARAERFETVDYLKSKYATVGWRINVIEPLQTGGDHA